MCELISTIIHKGALITSTILLLIQGKIYLPQEIICTAVKEIPELWIQPTKLHESTLRVQPTPPAKLCLKTKLLSSTTLYVTIQIETWLDQTYPKVYFFNWSLNNISNYCLISASELIRQVYIRLFVIAGEAHFRRLSSPESIDSHFRPIGHPRFRCCFSMRWSKDMLDAGIYYTGIITYEYLTLI